MSCRSGSFFFFQAEDGIRDSGVPGVQTCALPIPDPPSSGAATTSSASASPETSATASTAPRAGSPAEGLVAGDGYTFALPTGWRDATEQFKEYSELIDLGAVNAGQADRPFSDNVNVLRNADQDQLPPAQAEVQFTDELRTVASRVRVLPP